MVDHADPPLAISRTPGHIENLTDEWQAVPGTSIDGLPSSSPAASSFSSERQQEGGSDNRKEGAAAERSGVAAAVKFGMGSDFRVRFPYICVWHTMSKIPSPGLSDTMAGRGRSVLLNQK